MSEYSKNRKKEKIWHDLHYHVTFIPEEIFLERLPEIAKNAVADACTGSNPRSINPEEMEKAS